MTLASITVLGLATQSCSSGSGSSSSSSSSSSSASPPTAEFNALLAMSMHNAGVDNTDAKYVEDYDLAEGIGVNAAQVVVPWSAFEPTAGTYNTSLFTNMGWGLNTLSARGLKILLTFPILDIGDKTVPADIASLPLDDPIVKSRYRNAIDQLLPYLSADVVYFSVGNEVGGAEAKQAEFVEHVFTKWTEIGAVKLPFLAFFKRKEWNAASCDAMTGQVSGQPFWEFMCSLGFTHNDLSSKPAWTTLTDQIRQVNLR
jgi:hypothetical protein